MARYESERVRLQKNVDELTQENLFIKDLLIKK